jgi:hypothetical protein
MVDRPLAEEMAGGKTGLPSADDDRCDALDEPALRRR